MNEDDQTSLEAEKQRLLWEAHQELTQTVSRSVCALGTWRGDRWELDEASGEVARFIAES